MPLLYSGLVDDLDACRRFLRALREATGCTLFESAGPTLLFKDFVVLDDG